MDHTDFICQYGDAFHAKHTRMYLDWATLVACAIDGFANIDLARSTDYAEDDRGSYSRDRTELAESGGGF